MDGRIKDSGRILRCGSDNGYNKSGICSNLSDLLMHLEYEVVDQPVKSQLEKIREAIGDFYQVHPDKVYGMLYDQRCSSLHGESEAIAEYGVLLNLICLLCWNELLQ